MSEPTRGATAPDPDDGASLELQAYHDGELSGFARWRLERRLRRDPALQRELADLERVGEWVRTNHVEAPGPDLWESIAMRLPAADARREAGVERGRARGLGWLAVPGAVAATAVLAVAFAMGWLESAPPETGGVVRWLDSGGRDVMVLEGAPDTTIIWLIDAPHQGRAARRDT